MLTAGVVPFSVRDVLACRGEIGISAVSESGVPASLIIRVTATDDGAPPASSGATFTLTVSERNGAYGEAPSTRR